MIGGRGTVYTVLPAHEYLTDNVRDETLWWCGALVVEHRFITELCGALTREGFTLEPR